MNGFSQATFPVVQPCRVYSCVKPLHKQGAIAIVSDAKFAGKLPLFGGLDGARFRRQVVPGDTLEISASIGRMSARAGKGSGVVKVNGEIACECELLFVVVDA
jgi:3-hydroxyacyl-[acyl-carrier-protein] dehydratase